MICFQLQKLGYIRLVAIEGASERIMEARDIYESTISCYIGEESSTIIPDGNLLFLLNFQKTINFYLYINQTVNRTVCPLTSHAEGHVK